MTFRSSSIAPQRASTTQRLDVARGLLLTPFGLDEGHLARALAEIRTHQVDDADLYFQYTRSEGWSLEEGIVKTGSFSIDQGVGVRAVSGEKTAFAYSDDISLASLLDAARTVRAISSVAQTGRVRVPAKKIATSRSLYQGVDPIASLDSTAKVALLERLEQRARAKDPRVAQVMAGLASEYDVVLVARADGTLAADVRPLVRLSITVIAEQNGRRESYAHMPMPRMTNTYMLGGDKDPQEIIASIKKGLYASNFGGGQVDITSGKFVFSASEAYWVEDGKIQYPVKGATIVGSGPESLKKVTMIGNDMRLDSGVGTCGKEGQSVPVGVGQPTLRIDGLTVGGTA